MSTERCWQTCVHEAGHAVIGRVLGFEIRRITVEPTREYLGQVSAQTFDLSAVRNVPPEMVQVVQAQRMALAAYTLAGLAAEHQASKGAGFDVFEYLYRHAVADDGSLCEPHLAEGSESLDLIGLDHSEDLAQAWEYVGREWDRLEDALSRSVRGVRAAWRRIEAVARHLMREGTVTDDQCDLRVLIEGRGGQWYGRTLAALTGQS